VVGIDKFPAEFLSKGCKNENIGRMLTKLFNKIYDTGKFLTIWKTSLLYLKYKGKGEIDDREF
jgi:hypothetical protein